jgi:hypothetical protein
VCSIPVLIILIIVIVTTVTTVITVTIIPSPSPSLDLLVPPHTIDKLSRALDHGWGEQFTICCLLSKIYCLLSTCCCLLLSAVCCLLSVVVCCLLSALCCLVSGICKQLSSVCCLLMPPLMAGDCTGSFARTSRLQPTAFKITLMAPVITLKPVQSLLIPFSVLSLLDMVAVLMNVGSRVGWLMPVTSSRGTQNWGHR